MTEMTAYDPSVLPAGIRSRFVAGINGLTVHILEAGFETKGRPCLLLLHGFPELAYSWRKVMLPLAAAGYHVVAPDLRGYGRTTGWSADYDAELTPSASSTPVRDQLGLVSALGYRSVAAVIGHDFGSPVAAWCALVRPDVFRSVVLMSAPFGGPPPLPFDTATPPRRRSAGGPTILDDLAALNPPRKHYHWYYSTRAANADMCNCPQGLHAFLRAYYHHKSADWKNNKPYKLEAWKASELGQDANLLHHGARTGHGRDRGAAHAVGGRDRGVPVAHRRRAARLQLRVRAHQLPGRPALVSLAHGRPLRAGARDVLRPHHRRAVLFIAGKSDWGIYQRPGDLSDADERRAPTCTPPPRRWRGALGAAGAARGRGAPAAGVSGEAVKASGSRARLRRLPAFERALHLLLRSRKSRLSATVRDPSRSRTLLRSRRAHHERERPRIGASSRTDDAPSGDASIGHSPLGP